ncbi:MAG: RES family NAD+ phosphorylase [Planctomycetes bacterium]|nr:RES family NAD+ phosphorylase [Planctomycetota bacterium]
MVKEFDDDFELFIYMELDSWLSVNYFVCDSCVEEFRDLWKGININDESFQRNSMPLDCLYTGSKNLQFRYSLSEFRRFIKNIRCPNCGSNLSDNIWPYDLPTGIKKHIKDVEEIAELSKKAPFMILEHPFSRKILDFLKMIFENSSDLLIDYDVYRSRILKDQEKAYTIEESGSVPDYLAKEGRFNHAGYGFLYVATTKQLAFKETVSDNKIPVSMATIKILKKLKILDLTDIEDHDSDIYRTLMASSLMFNPPTSEDWDKPSYIFTRFIADCAIYIGFEAIKYNSIHSFDCHNLVILRDKTDKYFNWDSIYKIQKIDLYKNTDIM